MEEILGTGEDSAKRIGSLGRWQKCKYLKQTGGRDYCTFFFSLCAKDKCNPKYIK